MRSLPGTCASSFLPLIAAAVALSGCGGSDEVDTGDDAAQIRLVTAAFLEAYADSAPAACELLSPSNRARIEITSSSSADPMSCEEITEGFSGQPFDSDALKTSAERIDEAQVTIDGDYAYVAITTGEAPILGVILERTEDPVSPSPLGEEVEWLVDDTENRPL